MQGKSCIFKRYSPDESKVTGAVWGPLNKTLICGHESGVLIMLDAHSGEELAQTKPHTGPITGIKMHAHMPMFITSSKDHNAKVSYANFVV